MREVGREHARDMSVGADGHIRTSWAAQSTWTSGTSGTADKTRRWNHGSALLSRRRHLTCPWHEAWVELVVQAGRRALENLRRLLGLRLTLRPGKAYVAAVWPMELILVHSRHSWRLHGTLLRAAAPAFALEFQLAVHQHGQVGGLLLRLRHLHEQLFGAPGFGLGTGPLHELHEEFRLGVALRRHFPAVALVRSVMSLLYELLEHLLGTGYGRLGRGHWAGSGHVLHRCLGAAAVPAVLLKHVRRDADRLLPSILHDVLELKLMVLLLLLRIQRLLLLLLGAKGLLRLLNMLLLGLGLE